jgi:hypothetical protein
MPLLKIPRLPKRTDRTMEKMKWEKKKEQRPKRTMHESRLKKHIVSAAGWQIITKKF